MVFIREPVVGVNRYAPLFELPPRADRRTLVRDERSSSPFPDDIRYDNEVKAAYSGCCMCNASMGSNEGGTASKSFSSLGTRRIFCRFGLFLSV